MVGKGRFELPTSRSRTVHSNLAELLPEPPDSTTALGRAPCDWAVRYAFTQGGQQ
jgi:hypothetical protein